MEYSGAGGGGGKLIHEKNQKQKISWHCPFKSLLLPVLVNDLCYSSARKVWTMLGVTYAFRFLFCQKRSSAVVSIRIRDFVYCVLFL